MIDRILRKLGLCRFSNVTEALVDLMQARHQAPDNYITDKQFVAASQKARGIVR